MTKGCKRCTTNTLVVEESFGIDYQGSQPFATIKFGEPKQLVSPLNNRLVRVKANEWIDVYYMDLAQWIRNGMRKLMFQDPDKELDFLTTYTEIKAYHYAN